MKLQTPRKSAYLIRLMEEFCVGVSIKWLDVFEGRLVNENFSEDIPLEPNIYHIVIQNQSIGLRYISIFKKIT